MIQTESQPESQPAEKKPGLWVWGTIFVLALVIRIGATQQFVGLSAEPDAGSNPDQVDYEGFAAELAKGNGYRPEGGALSARRPPGTSFALLAVYSITGRNYLAGRLWFCFLSALSALLAGLACAYAFGRRAGVWTALGLALYPGHFYYAMHFLSEPVFGLWTTLFCAACLASMTLRGHAVWWAALGAGLALGLGILTRPQHVFIFPIAAALLVLVPGLRKRKYWLPAILQGVVALAVVAPWVVRNHEVVGKATISTIGGYTFWGANNAVIDAKPHRRGSWMPVDSLIDAEHPVEGSEVEREAATWRYGKEFLQEHPERVPGLVLMKLRRLVSPFRDTPNRTVYWTFAVAWIAIAPWVLVGFLAAWRRSRSATLVFLLPLGAMVGTAMAFYGSTRFRDSLCVILLTFAGVGLGALQERLTQRKMSA